jgi:hypothetical protein
VGGPQVAAGILKMKKQFNQEVFQARPAPARLSGAGLVSWLGADHS